MLMTSNVVENTFRFVKEPLRVTLILSTLLSIIAVLGVVVIGRDGALYITIAEKINANGLGAAFSYFNWPWFSILLAYTHKVTGIGYESIAYFYSIGFMVGTSLLIVSIVKKLSPEAVWWTVILVLSVPAYNSFRYDIIRESGFWFFCILTLWLVLKDSKITWLNGVFIQGALLLAVLFRFEAFFLFPVISVYILTLKRELVFKRRIFELFKAFSLYFVVAVLAVIFAVHNDIFNQSRVYGQIALLNPISIYTEFQRTSDVLAQAAFAKWSYSDAPVVLFFGMLCALVLRLFTYVGISSLLVLSKKSRKPFLNSFYKYRLLALAALAYFTILMIFFIQEKFLNSRYSSLFILLIIPFLSVMAAEFFKDKKRLTIVAVLLSIILALANVISLSAKKYHYLAAAEWIEKNTIQTDAIYYSDARIKYYARRGYGEYPDINLEQVKDLRFLKYKYFVVETNISRDEIEAVFDSQGFLLAASFDNGSKYVYILQRI